MRFAPLVYRFLGAAAVNLLAAFPLLSQTPLDDTCVVSALNRSTRVLPDGSWVLPNVPSSFGQIRVRANCVENGVTRAGQSGFVTLPPDGVLRVSDIAFAVAQPIPARLALRAPREVLGAAGETMRLEAIATLPDGSTADVTEAAAGTNYRSSNPAVAAVDANGVVTANASGTVLISATHEGALGLARITVVASLDSDGDGLPDDFEIENGLDPLNDADAQLDPDQDGLSTGEEFLRGLDPFDPDTDGDGLNDGLEVLVLGTDPLRFDTDGDGVSDGLEVELGTDPLDPTSFDFGPALVALEIQPPSFAIVFDTVLGDASVDLTVRGALRDGTEVDLTAPARGTAYLSSDLEVCGLGVEPGRVFAGRPGDCTITAANAGFTAEASGIVQTFSPRFLASVAIPGSANAVAVVGDRAFVAAGEEGLQIVDVANRRLPTIAAALELAGSAHDVAVASGLAFVAAGDAGLAIADVSDPESPRHLATVPLGAPARGVAAAGGQGAGPEPAALVLVAADAGGLSVVDVSDPGAPFLLGSAATTGPARAVAVHEGGSIAVVAEGPLGVEVIDLAEPSRPVVRGRAATADARAVTLAGDHALIADAVSSLTVVDLSDPDQPLVVASVPRALGGVPADVARFGSLAFLADIGFFADEAVPIFDVTDPRSPLARTRLALPTEDPGRGIAADATYVYLVACAGCDSASTSGRSHLDIGQYRSLVDSFGVPPQVTITAPRDGDLVAAGASLQVEAEASDDVGVLAVELLVDGAVAGRDERPPYGFALPVPDGASRLRLGARAFDFAANRGMAEEVEVAVVRAGTTALSGMVLDPEGAPVADARVVVGSGTNAAAGAPSTVTAPDGTFLLTGVTVSLVPIVVHGSALLAGGKHRGSSAPTLPVAGGTTDVGAIRLEPIGVLYPGPRVFTGSTAASIARADFDRDGTDDLAVVHTAPAEGLAILAGKSDGRLALRQRLGVTGSFLVAGDLTLDGAPDLLIGSSSTGRVTVAVNQGDGTFAADGSTSSVGTTPRRAKIGDFDSDGLPDVLVLNTASGDLSLLLGNGDGTLRAQVRIPVGAAAEGLEVGDFDLDGALDVAVARAGSAGDSVVTILRGDGAGGLASAGVLPLSPAPRHVVAGDLDRDGVPDLAIGAGWFTDALHVFGALGRGDGTFALASPRGTSMLGFLRSMALADFDGDGELDLAVARDLSPCGDVRVLWAIGGGRFDANPMGVITDECDVREIAVGNRATAAAEGVAALPDLLSLDQVGGVTTYLNAGGRGFERRLVVGSGSAPVAVLAGHDLDGDGHLDLVYRSENGGLGIRLGNGDGTFREAPGISTGIFLHQLAAGDVNRDGAVDLVVASLDDLGVLLGAGDGTFAPPILMPVARSLTSLRVADVTGDGAPDVLATHGVRGEWLVFESLGGGVLETAAASAVGDGPRDAVVADLDGDGILDAAVLNFVSADVSVLLGEGGGRFAAQVRYPAGTRPISIAAADLNLDGALDLVVANTPAAGTPSGPRGVSVLLGTGDGAFGAPLLFGTGTVPGRIAAADLDVDGIPDVVLVHPSTNDVSVLLGLGDGTLLAPERTHAGNTPVWLDVVDVDRDGLPDLVTANRGDTGGASLSVLLHR
ncbi:MAG TPA: FG-GAP-like repeat-containing protein [Thermoanaerobaculia bacterium]|nr:FG-GAP-like repeat-containing protein [Thermoanaerobaculia bacterium]